MTQTQPAPAPTAEPTRTYPSRRDPGRGGRARPVDARRHVPEPALAPEPVHDVRPADANPAPRPDATQLFHAVEQPRPAPPVRTPAPTVVHTHVFDPVRAAARTSAEPTPAAEPARAERSPERRPARKPARKGRTPGRWAGIGVGLTVAVATTTTLTAIAPQAAAPESGDGPTTGSLEAITAAAAAAVDDRDGAASRSGARTGVAPASAVKSVAGGAKVTVSDKATMSVESLDRGEIQAPPPVLPGCEGQAAGSGSNGQIPSSELCTLWDGHTQVRGDAAVALAELNEAYQAAWGESMCITDGFRSYSQQVATKAAKGYLAAVPGTSNHGWGLAVDICPETYAGSRWDWLAANAPAYGWDNPDWARPGGSKYEPWHWEYTAGVTQMGGY
ncbi:M15 family metallopeptidase [Krasilnikoviella flava]|uniref:D-alanyl-D-alanine carboxypeptidase n=1 Tax=Krasilnikoviella flava TaxID=526729 RepID=A0A1T5KB17_9MICO|nr:M15 family metallopeptidase [Krasilnikoviella flava]SKC60857.1 D-alanyl-D-alanine carboxypeptidase [Krasilnikoviella flava]